MTDAHDFALATISRTRHFFITRDQRQAVYSKWQQSNQGLTYRQFRLTVQPGWDCIMVKWCGMWVGIEKDGYAHT